MAIRWTTALGANAVVAAADIITTEKKPMWDRPVGCILAGLGYILGGVMGIGGDFVKNLGISAGPWAMESVYLWIKESTQQPISVAPREVRLPLHRPAAPVAPVAPVAGIGRYPAPARLPEFADVRVD